MNYKQILDDHLFNADIATLTGNSLREVYTIADAIKASQKK